MTLIEREAPSHWYLRDGRAFHQIARSDGSGDRAVTLADARKVQALPSVTNVLGVLAKPGLDAWKIEQGIMAALTLPRTAEEPLDVFAKRVVADMSAQVDKAADFGTAIHGACERYALLKEVPTDATLLGFFEPWQEWFDDNVEQVDSIEQVFVHSGQGFAGRVDMVARLRGLGWCVVDFKTQKMRRGPAGRPPRATFYETWPLQLSAYQQAMAWQTGKLAPRLVSVVMNSVEPGPVHVKVWKPAESYVEAFDAALTLWRYVKDYDPSIVLPPGMVVVSR